MKYKPNTLTRGEQSIMALLKDFAPMTAPEIAAALGSNPKSIHVMVFNIREKGITIAGGEPGPRTKGYWLP
jgi:hypothetical protein